MRGAVVSVMCCACESETAPFASCVTDNAFASRIANKKQIKCENNSYMSSINLFVAHDFVQSSFLIL